MRIITSLVLVLAGFNAMAASAFTFVEEAPEGLPAIRAVTAMTQGPNHHFVGYYGIPPWSPDGTRLFCLQTDFADREVTEHDRATLGLIDVASKAFTPLTEVAAWNFQQGCLAHWLDDGRLIYNDRFEGDVHATILDIGTGEKKRLPLPLAAVSQDGRRMASISYARLNITRPGYGYPGLTAESTDHPHPDNDGLYVVDLETGESNLIVSLGQVFRDQPPPEGRKDDMIWFNHVLFNPAGDRLFFLARFKSPVGPLISASYTVATDGSDLRCVVPYAWNSSHFDWRGNDMLMVTSRFQGEGPWRHLLFTDGAQDHRVMLPDLLDGDGHGHFSKDGRWMVSDSYPRGANRMQALYLVDVERDTGYEAAKFHQPREYSGPWRCDLHPRWSRDGKQVCIDSTHEGTRQVYVLDLDFPG